MFRRIGSALAASALLLTMATSAVSAGGPPGLAFFVDDARYRTVLTPTDLADTGAPASTYDRLYDLGPGLIPVAESKPGDSDYNGGRWMVLPVTWNVTPVQLTNAEDVEAYADLNMLTIAETPAKLFVCPVIPVQGGRH